MHRRCLSLVLSLALFLVLGANAAAAPRDAAANKKIDEAINVHYLATDFDKAESVLTGTITACGDKCSPAVIAKAWMYVGIVRGSGKGDQAGAADAFRQAAAADPGVKLDDALATAETKKAFDDIVGGSGATTKPPKPGKPPPSEDVAGDMDCQPRPKEVETRRSIPISCTTEEEAVRAEIRYREFGGDNWKTIKMTKRGDVFQGEIPCAATGLAGALRYFVRAQDAAGDVVDSYGSRSKPVEVSIVSSTDEEPPAFPDKDPPQRCAEAVECPPDFPGCKAGGGTKPWGASCGASSECESGLSCINGTCETAQSCDIDADCPSGTKCVSGKCDRGGGASGPWKQNWLGFHVAHDLAIVGGTDVCSQASQDKEGFACYYKGTEDQYFFDPQPGVANKISTGIASATTRVLLSFDRVLTPNIMLGARAGFAFGGGPAAGPQKDVKFLPFHGELRGSYWLGNQPFSKPGLRPYVHVGGGVAQVDAKLPVTIRDCATAPSPDGCKIGNSQGDPLELDAYKKLGQGFVAVGGGALYALSANGGIQLNLNVMFMLPTSGQVIEPSLGYVFGL
ncbi:MAG: hypothetical protein KF718_23035 [Polyangiaceae bacterium]|nr:hypothetical protein [Polyangiaceae bacterium]